MALDNSDLINRLVAQADIVQIISGYIPLTKRGRNFLGVCPFHDDTHASLCVSPEKKMYKCFSCGHGGNVIHFVQEFEHIPFWDAVRKVADVSGFHDPALEKNAISNRPKDERKDNILNCLADLTLYYSYSLSTQEGQDGLAYFEQRHLDSNLRSKFKLGYANKDGHATIEFLKKKNYSLKVIEDTGIAVISSNNVYDKNQGRVIFPICDYEGNVVGFSARRLSNNSDEAKYINSPETYVFHKSNILYNYHIAKEACRNPNYIYVCEGFMDVFALSRIGIDACVALMGTALTEEHISLLKRLNVQIRLCLDGDLAGQTAMMKAARLLQKHNVDFVIVDNQGTKDDPDEILNNQGPDALKAYLNNLLGYMDFALNYYLRSNPLKTSDEKRKLITAFVPILSKMDSALEFDSYVRKLSKITGYEVESIKTVVKQNNTNNYDELTLDNVMKRYQPENKGLRRLLIAEREVLYQMTKESSAVNFYENNINGFYNTIYREIANYIVEYASTHDNIDATGLIASLQTSDLENKDELIKTITDIAFERNHPNQCSEDLLNDLLRTISIEKEKIFEDDTYNQCLKGKDDLEKARILDEYNKRKAKKIN